MSELKVTTLEELKEYAKGAVVEFPPFAEGQPFVARVKRPSMLEMMRTKKIPNDLLNAATTLFSNSKTKSNVVSNSEAVNNMLDTVDTLAKECLVNPTLDDIKDSGLDLTDEQKMFLFEYIQSGVKSLKPFREKQGHIESGNNVSAL